MGFLYGYYMGSSLKWRSLRKKDPKRNSDLESYPFRDAGFRGLV